MKARRVIPSLLAFALLAAWTTPTPVAAEQSHAALKAQAKVPEADARKMALAEVPGGTIKSAELERERGKLIWSFDIAMPESRNITEVQVDANAGTVVSTAIETPADQEKEAAADREVEQ
jgi:Peptidase propeptide and YPEB domain